MKKVYVVLSGHGSYVDYHQRVECVCINPIFAEGKKAKIENRYREEIPFPFDWCTEEEFFKLLCEHKVVPEDEIAYDNWTEKNFIRENFISCLIQEVDFYE